MNSIPLETLRSGNDDSLLPLHISIFQEPLPFVIFTLALKALLYLNSEQPKLRGKYANFKRDITMSLGFEVIGLIM